MLQVCIKLWDTLLYVLLTSSIQVLPAVAAPTVANRDASPIPGYGIEELIWEVETTPGGPTVNITGTVENVYEELEKINPTFVSDFRLDDPDNSPSLAAPVKSRGYTIQSFNCNVYDYASLKAIQAGLVYLNGVPGKPSNGPGPGNCGRVSCSYNSAIYWCNDVRYKPFRLPSVKQNFIDAFLTPEHLYQDNRHFRLHFGCCPVHYQPLWHRVSFHTCWWRV